MDPASRLTFYNNACAQKKQIALMEREFGPVIVGEWSLATDNCAMWLNGFNDNLPGFPRSPCKYIACSAPYMGEEQPGTPVDIGKPVQVSCVLVLAVDMWPHPLPTLFYILNQLTHFCCISL